MSSKTTKSSTPKSGLALLTLVSVLLGLTSIVALLYKPLKLRADVLGITRPLSSIQNIHGHILEAISGTRMCEDMHVYTGATGQVIIAACEGEGNEGRWKWFPGDGQLGDPSVIGQGHFVVIDPKTFTSTPLTFTNFVGPFVTHGIDIVISYDDPSKLYIYAINHLPDPVYVEAFARARALNTSVDSYSAAASQVELFEHTLGSTMVTHLRSIKHPLIATPNDIQTTSPTTFYITNDHHYRAGLLRGIEDMAWQPIAPWGKVLRVNVEDVGASEPTSALQVSVALKGIHNPNGMGTGAIPSEILIARAAAGVLVLAEEIEQTTPRSWLSFKASTAEPSLLVKESIQLPSTIDNPTYFHDPYVAQTGRDASGYLLAGLARACDLGHTCGNPKGQDPSMVWLLQRSGESEGTSSASGEGTSANEEAGSNILDQPQVGEITKGKIDGGWKTTLVFQDDGLTLRTATTAILVAIDPAENEGRKQGWLFVTGFLSENIVATKIDL